MGETRGTGDFRRAAKSFAFVIPRRPEPRSPRRWRARNLLFLVFFRSFFEPCRSSV